MMHTLCLKDALKVTVHMQKFIESKVGKGEETVAMIKDNQSLYETYIFIKMTKPFVILLRMAKSNQPRMDKLQFMVLIVDHHIRMSMPESNGD